MRQTLLAVTTVLLVAAAAAAAELRSDVFTVSLPDAFAVPTKTVATKSGIETTSWVAKAPSTNEAVVITVSKMPAKIVDAAKLLDSTRDSLLKSVNGTLESEQPLTGALTGRTLLFKSGSAFLRSELIVDGDRLYQLLYVGRSQEQRTTPLVGQMFDSFKISNLPMTSAAH